MDVQVACPQVHSVNAKHDTLMFDNQKYPNICSLNFNCISFFFSLFKTQQIFFIEVIGLIAFL